MSEPLDIAPRIEFAMTDPAQAIAPVFLSLASGKRTALEVRQTFSGTHLRWYGPQRLDIADQTVLLTLLCLAPQRPIRVAPGAAGNVGKQLLRNLHATRLDRDLHLWGVKTTCKELLLCSGCTRPGGKHYALVRASLARLAETTLKEASDASGLEGDELSDRAGKDSGRSSSSRLLSYLETADGTLLVLLHPRATLALSKGQFARISLVERLTLSSTVARALHAWLSASLRKGHAKTYDLEGLHKHVWPDAASGSTSRARDATLRTALRDIGALPGWRCAIAQRRVELKRER